MKKVIICSGILVCLSIVLPVSAEVIILKSGDRIEGNIIEQSAKELVIDYKGVPITYYTFEVESIDSKPLIVGGVAKDNQTAEISKIDAVTAEEYYKRGSAYYSRGNFNQAISDFTKAIRVKPDYAEAFASRGLCYMNRKEAEEAISDFTKAIKFNPKFEEAYYLRGMSFAAKGKTEEAISDYAKAIELNPKYIQAYLNRGFIYFRTGMLEKAITDFDSIIKINPAIPEAYFLRGVSYTNKGNYDQAVINFNKAIELNPRYAEAYAARGLVYAFKAKADQYKSDANSPKTFVNIGPTYIEKKEFEKALADCAKAIEINPAYTDAYINRIKIFVLSHDYDLAWKDVRKVEELGGKVDPQIIEDLKKAQAEGGSAGLP